MKEEHGSLESPILDLCDTGAALYQSSQQANWEQVIELFVVKTLTWFVFVMFQAKSELKKSLESQKAMESELDDHRRTKKLLESK